MNYINIIGVTILVIGIYQYVILRPSKNYHPDWMGTVISYIVLIFAVVVGSFLFTAGTIKFVEMDLRGKSIDEIQKEYNDISNKQ